MLVQIVEVLLIICGALWVLGIYAWTEARDMDLENRRRWANLYRAPDIAWTGWGF